MRIVVTGSAGHLGEALVRTLSKRGDQVIGIDILASAFTDVVGSILDRELMEQVINSADAIVHAATLHKPHVATHSKQQFIDVNVSGTQTLLEIAIKQRVRAFLFTSTTSTYGQALSAKELDPAIWVTENLRPIPKNIYGVTKIAAEDLCQLAHQEHGLPCIVLKTSRFFPEEDDMSHTLPGYSQENIKAIEFLNRRVEIEDVVRAHELALNMAPELRFDKFIISATTPFSKEDLQQLGNDAAAVIRKYFPNYERVFTQRGWKMFPRLDRVYVNQRARDRLGWEPKYDFGEILGRLEARKSMFSELSVQIGAKGYHNMAEKR